MSRKRQACARVMFSRARPWNAARPISVWFNTPTASPASITRLLRRRGEPVVDLAQHAPHVVGSAVAHEHRQPLQIAPPSGADCRGGPGQKWRRAIRPRTPRRSAATPALAAMPGNCPCVSSVCNSGAEQRQRPARAFGIEPQQRAAQQPRRWRRRVRNNGRARKNCPPGATAGCCPCAAVRRSDSRACSSVISSTGRGGRDPGVLAAAAACCMEMKFSAAVRRDPRQAAGHHAITAPPSATRKHAEADRLRREPDFVPRRRGGKFHALLRDKQVRIKFNAPASIRHVRRPRPDLHSAVRNAGLTTSWSRFCMTCSARGFLAAPPRRDRRQF